MERQQWTEADFDELSWHDNHVHSLEVRSGEYGAGELIMGFGYLVAWHPPDDGGEYAFSIAPAELHFRAVTELRIEIDYAAASAALTPFSIHTITRTDHQYSAEMGTHCYTIEVNWPHGGITFTAAG